jgi:hypothetical protein
MATAYILEFADWPSQKNLVMAKWSSRVVEQTPVTFTTTTQSAAFASTTRYIAFKADAAFHWTIGSNPTATTSKMKQSAEEYYHIEVQPGDKIAFVTAA